MSSSFKNSHMGLSLFASFFAIICAFSEISFADSAACESKANEGKALCDSEVSKIKTELETELKKIAEKKLKQGAYLLEFDKFAQSFKQKIITAEGECGHHYKTAQEICKQGDAEVAQTQAAKKTAASLKDLATQAVHQQTQNVKAYSDELAKQKTAQGEIIRQIKILEDELIRVSNLPTHDALGNSLGYGSNQAEIASLQSQVSEAKKQQTQISQNISSLDKEVADSHTGLTEAQVLKSSKEAEEQQLAQVQAVQTVAVEAGKKIAHEVKDDTFGLKFIEAQLTAERARIRKIADGNLPRLGKTQPDDDEPGASKPTKPSDTSSRDPNRDSDSKKQDSADAGSNNPFQSLLGGGGGGASGSSAGYPYQKLADALSGDDCNNPQAASSLVCVCRINRTDSRCRGAGDQNPEPADTSGSAARGSGKDKGVGATGVEANTKSKDKTESAYQNRKADQSLAKKEGMSGKVEAPKGANGKGTPGGYVGGPADPNSANVLGGAYKGAGNRALTFNGAAIPAGSKISADKNYFFNAKSRKWVRLDARQTPPNLASYLPPLGYRARNPTSLVGLDGITGPHTNQFSKIRTRYTTLFQSR